MGNLFTGKAGKVSFFLGLKLYVERREETHNIEAPAKEANYLINEKLCNSFCIYLEVNVISLFLY